jgi:5-formyltetrahydrofolate cyclo-ligase
VDVAARKAEARDAARQVRRAASAGFPDAGARLAAFAERVTRDADGAPAAGSAALVVAGYWPIADEIDCRPLLAALAVLGCALALPVVAGPGQPLLFRAWAPGAPLETGPHGTRQPGPDAALVRPTVVLVPLLAFDRALYRLGYGGGYYDRTLESLRNRSQVRGGYLSAIGLAYAAQEVSAVPRDGKDQRLDAVLTERGPIEKGSG